VNHLALLNAVLALRFKQPGWPTILHDAGYLVHGVGVTFKLPNGDTVTPDILASSNSRNVALLIEVKGGSGFKHEQAGRMERVTALDLRDSAYLPIADPTEYRVAIVYVCAADHHNAFNAVVTERAIGTVVSFDGVRFRFGGASLVDTQLQQAWAAIEVPLDTPPIALIPFDQDSDVATVARVVIPEIVSLLISGGGVVTIDGVLQRTHNVVYDVMQSTGSKSEWKELRNKVSEFVSDAAKSELSPWLSRIPGQPMWNFRSAFPADQTTRTRELKNLQRSTLTLIERHGGGPPSQLDFFDDLDQS
jgi:hypothetical protein